jgi:tetratricopeptide (TPR) repeat protein
MRLLRLCAAALLLAIALGRPSQAQPSLPGPTPQEARTRVEELEREARDLYHAGTHQIRRNSPERVTLLQRAISVLMRALALDEHNAELRLLLGNWLNNPELGDAALRQSVVELLRARQDDPIGALAYEIAEMLGIVYSHLERFTDAVAEYDRALQLLAGEPDMVTSSQRQQRAQLLGNSAEALMALGKLDEAIRRYALAESIDHSDLATLQALGLAVAYDRDGQLTKSHDALQRALAADPGLRTFQSDEVFFVPEGDRHYYWGLLQQEFANRDEAIQSFRDFLAEVPHSRYASRAREHILELQRQSGLSAAELLRARVYVGAPQFPPDAQSGIALHRHREETEVHRVVNDRSFELRQCYARSLRHLPTLRGDLLVALMLDRYGAVLLVQTLENALSEQPQREGSSESAGATELQRCVQNTIYRWRFTPADPDVVDQDELALPLRFTTP